MQRAAALDLADFEHQGYYDQIHEVLADAETRAPLLLQQVVQLVQAVPQLAGYIVALVSLSPLLVFLILATKIPTAAAWGSSGQYGWTLLREQTRQRRLADYYASTLTERGFAQEVRLYGLAGYLLDQWAILFRQTRDERRQRLLYFSLPSACCRRRLHRRHLRRPLVGDRRRTAARRRRRHGGAALSVP